MPKGTRFHDLRHFYASTLIAANLNPKVIQARLGHATIADRDGTRTSVNCSVPGQTLKGG
jgi:integrase